MGEKIYLLHERTSWLGRVGGFDFWWVGVRGTRFGGGGGFCWVFLVGVFGVVWVWGVFGGGGVFCFVVFLWVLCVWGGGVGGLAKGERTFTGVERRSLKLFPGGSRENSGQKLKPVNKKKRRPNEGGKANKSLVTLLKIQKGKEGSELRNGNHQGETDHLAGTVTKGHTSH